MPKRGSIPTWTTRVMELLMADPFLTAKAIQARLPMSNANQISAALSHLRNRKAVRMETDAGEAYWYATPDTDDRTIVQNERVPEQRPRRRRRKNAGS